MKNSIQEVNLKISNFLHHVLAKAKLTIGTVLTILIAGTVLLAVGLIVGLLIAKFGVAQQLANPKSLVAMELIQLGKTLCGIVTIISLILFFVSKGIIDSFAIALSSISDKTSTTIHQVTKIAGEELAIKVEVFDSKFQQMIANFSLTIIVAIAGLSAFVTMFPVEVSLYNLVGIMVLAIFAGSAGALWQAEGYWRQLLQFASLALAVTWIMWLSISFVFPGYTETISNKIFGADKIQQINNQSDQDLRKEWEVKLSELSKNKVKSCKDSLSSDECMKIKNEIAKLQKDLNDLQPLTSKNSKILGFDINWSSIIFWGLIIVAVICLLGFLGKFGGSEIVQNLISIGVVFLLGYGIYILVTSIIDYSNKSNGKSSVTQKSEYVQNIIPAPNASFYLVNPGVSDQDMEASADYEFMKAGQTCYSWATTEDSGMFYAHFTPNFKGIRCGVRRGQKIIISAVNADQFIDRRILAGISPLDTKDPNFQYASLDGVLGRQIYAFKSGRIQFGLYQDPNGVSTAANVAIEIKALN